MKTKDLKTKEVSELTKMAQERLDSLSKVTMEHHMYKDKNVKKLANLRREVAILKGMISGRGDK
jgi:ribosomal protein L29